MRATEFITEMASDIVYHYTSTHNAARILNDGYFQLSRSTGNKSEEQYAPPGYDYFFSTTRSKVGDYHRYAGNGAVMFVIDGRWLNHNYKTKPVDYWERSWQHAPGRTREAEDRVFSKTPEIPLDGVIGIHAYIREKNEWRSPLTRGILIAGKKRGLPTYLYNDEQAWRLQNTNKAVSVKNAGELLSGVTPSRKSYSPPTDYLEPWIELIHKKSKAELTPEADKLRYNLVYYGSRYENEDSGLGNAFSNERKPGSTGFDSATAIVNYMRQNKVPSLLALKNALCKKWEAIK